ncbi:MAG: SRPBCC family protein [Bryobacteraceae bacterium]
MQLSSDIVINKSREEVWSFLAEPRNIAKWDRGVKAVEIDNATLSGEGLEFTTVGCDASAPNQGRMTYRIGQPDQEADSRVDLTSREGNARYFKSAYWSFRVLESERGPDKTSRIECFVHFDLRPRYLWLAPVLFFMKGAIKRDLIGLKRVLETT